MPSTIQNGFLRDGTTAALVTSGLTAGAAAFPIPSAVSDDFNRANEAPMEGDWAQLRLGGGTTPLLGVFGNISAAESDADCNQVWDVAEGADVDAFVTVVAGKQDSGKVICGIYLRLVQGASPDYVGVTVTRTAGAEDWALVSAVAGVVTTHSTTAHAMAVNDKVGLRVEGTTLTAYLFTAAAWSQVATTAITTPTATGKAALQTNGTNTGFDNWTIGPLA